MTLFVLAAGLGSRYGGLKQMDPMTPHGEFIIDFSVFDAIRAGFDRVVFVIKEENYEALAPEAIELTLENWETYFEIREAQDDIYTAMGELEFIQRGFGIFLREEYIERMTDMPLDISFKAAAVAHWYQVLTEDYASGIYEIGEQTNRRDLGIYGSESWSGVEKVRYRTSRETSDFYQKYAAPFLGGGGYTNHEKKEYFTDIVDSLQVEAVQGILYLKQQ
jgi:hypothetical protein